MFDLARKYAKGTCAHGYAGIASWFVALADRMTKSDGTIALVLPMTALQGSSWQKVRQLIADEYSDVTIVTIATPRSGDQSFSADTGMAETLIVGRKAAIGTIGRGMFVALNRRPRSEMESLEIAKAISGIAGSASTRNIEDGPVGGYPLDVGEERIGEVIVAPLDSDLPWSAVGIADFSVPQSAYQLSQGQLWLPRMSKKDRSAIPMTVIQNVCQVGITHNNIVGNGKQAAFFLDKSLSSVPSYPMLWNHDAKKETKLIVQPTAKAESNPTCTRARLRFGTRAVTRFTTPISGFNSQPLGGGFHRRTARSAAEPGPISSFDKKLEIAYSLWGNSTLGLLLYWWHSSRQQAGRGRMPITAIRTLPTLDVTSLSDAQLQTAESIFNDMRHHDFLPANEAYRDMSRQELDRRVLLDLLGLPDTVLEPLDVLRLKWCSEPSVHGGKGTGP